MEGESLEDEAVPWEASYPKAEEERVVKVAEVVAEVEASWRWLQSHLCRAVPSVAGFLVGGCQSPGETLVPCLQVSRRMTYTCPS